MISTNNKVKKSPDKNPMVVAYYQLHRNNTAVAVFCKPGTEKISTDNARAKGVPFFLPGEPNPPGFRVIGPRNSEDVFAGLTRRVRRMLGLK